MNHLLNDFFLGYSELGGSVILYFFLCAPMLGSQLLIFVTPITNDLLKTIQWFIVINFSNIEQVFPHMFTTETDIFYPFYVRYRHSNGIYRRYVISIYHADKHVKLSYTNIF